MKLRKLFLILFTVALTALMMSFCASAEITEEDFVPNEDICIICSDVDFDGSITSADARLIMRFAVELEMPTTMQERIADVDGDGELSSADARATLRVAVKLDAMPAHISDETVTITPATCAKNGEAASLCKRCGLLFNRGVVPSPGHVGSGYIITKEATCTEQGTREKRCIYCDMLMYEEKIPIIAHDYITPKADCLKFTNAELVCKVCGYKKSVVLPPIGAHSFKYYTVTPVTCTSNGLREKRCENCGLVLEGSQEVITCIGSHREGNWIVTEYQSCLTQGKRIKKCEICGVTLEEEVIPREDHVPREITVLFPSTCTVHGTQSYVCIKCGNKITEELPLAPHIIDETIPAVRVDSTCHTEGSLTRTCTVCGEFTEIIAKKPHSQTGVWQVIKMPTCTVDGTEALYCNNPGCDELVKTRPLKASGSHSYEVTQEVPPTCQSAGSQKLVCSICGDEKTQVLAKLDHCVPENTEGIFQHATATQNEIRGYFCKFCGEPIHSTAHEIPGTMLGTD